MFLTRPARYIYVVDEDGQSVGVVALRDVTSLLLEKGSENAPCAADLVHRDALNALAPETGLADALQRFVEHRGERLPVIQSHDNPRLLGVA
jgi:chloride channel protein, CIC family